MNTFSFQEFAGNAEKLLASIKEYAKKGGRATTKTLLELYYGYRKRIVPKEKP